MKRQKKIALLLLATGLMSLGAVLSGQSRSGALNYVMPHEHAEYANESLPWYSLEKNCRQGSLLRSLFLTATSAGRSSSTRTILAIFAHADDDVSIGPLLAHYAKRGVRVYLAVVTAAGGQEGVVRGAESKAASHAYGISEPFLLREEQGALASMQRQKEVLARLREIVRQVKPPVIITWGPDGLSGHPDHRAVSNLVTELFQDWEPTQTDLFVPQKLYYVTYPQSKPVLPRYNGFIKVADSFITTIIGAQDGL